MGWLASIHWRGQLGIAYGSPDDAEMKLLDFSENFNCLQSWSSGCMLTLCRCQPSQHFRSLSSIFGSSCFLISLPSAVPVSASHSLFSVVSMYHLPHHQFPMHAVLSIFPSTIPPCDTPPPTTAQCVLRLRAVLQLEGQIRRLLPLVPGFVPPAAIFDADAPPLPPAAAAKKQKPPPKRSVVDELK